MGNSTIFDDVLRTIQERLPSLLIPLVNEVFHTSYPMDTEVTRLPEEYQKVVSKIIADSCNRMGGKVYHFECQSTKDNGMILRMVEYDFMIALSESRRKRKRELQFPRSCIIYLRSTKNTLAEESVVLKLADGQTVKYKVPVLKLRDYSIDEIFEKNLLILLPYYIIKYERELQKIASDEQQIEKLVEEYRNIVYRLEKLAKEDNTGMFRDLARMMRKIVEHLLRKQPDLKERVCETMGGKVLRLPSDELREAVEAGVAEGRAEGANQSKREIITNMINRGMPIEDICAIVECDEQFVEEVRKAMK